MADKEFYTMKIAGLERNLPICPLNEDINIAGFIMFSDVEITVKAAEELLKKAPDFDIILTSEAKGIPLAYEMSRQSGKTYIVARKGIKLYMKEPFGVEVKSITTAGVQHLYLSKADKDLMKGKKILIADDVISTGESLNALVKLVDAVGGILVGQFTVLAEGDAAKRDDITFLEELPILPNK